MVLIEWTIGEGFGGRVTTWTTGENTGFDVDNGGKEGVKATTLGEVPNT
jgi:hypothetical protein